MAARAGEQERLSTAVDLDRRPVEASPGHRGIEISIPSDTRHLPALRAFLQSLIEVEIVTDPGRQVLGELQLVLQEACVNSIRHASKRRADEPITVRFIPIENGITIEVCDHGTGFDPAEVPEPVPGNMREGGYGVFIIGRFMDSVEVGRRGDQFVMSMTRTFDDHGPAAAGVAP